MITLSLELGTRLVASVVAFEIAVALPQVVSFQSTTRPDPELVTSATATLSDAPESGVSES